DFDFSSNARPGRAQVVDAPVNLAEPRNVVNRASSFTRNASGGANGNRANESGSGFGGGNFTNRPQVHSAGSGSAGGRMPAEEDDFDQLPAVGPSSGSGATEKQIKAIYAIGRSSKRLSESQVDDRCAELFGILPAELTKAEASQFIDILKGEAAA